MACNTYYVWTMNVKILQTCLESPETHCCYCKMSKKIFLQIHLLIHTTAWGFCTKVVPAQQFEQVLPESRLRFDVPCL